MKIIKMLIAIIIALFLIAGATAIIGETIISEASIPSEDGVIGLTLEKTTDIETMRQYISICDARMEQSHAMAEMARALGYQDTHKIIQTAKEEYNSALKLKQYYQPLVEAYDLEQARIEAERKAEQERAAKIEAERKAKEEAERKAKEEAERKAQQAVIKQTSGQYPNATQVWNIMKSYGWSDIVCAGIMGNMMRECGGDTLNLNPYAGSSHYGLCQWSKQYHGGAWGKDIAGQLAYLKSTLNLNIFNGCSTPEAAAEKFCWSYERPAKSDPAYKRLANARTAYNYFCN